MKNKKSIAMAMAAVSTFGAVAPAFANEVAPRAVVNKVDVALSEGNKVQVLTYGEVYDTHFTADKKDDTLKKGLTILDVISNKEGEEKYLVASELTIADVKKMDGNADKTDAQLKSILANMIATEKANLEDTIKDINHKLTLSYVNDKNEKKALYTINKEKSGEVQAEQSKGIAGNYYLLVLTNNETKTEETITFTNIKVEEKATEDKVEVKTANVDLYDEGFTNGYTRLSRYAFELGTAKNITVETKEINPTTLEVKVFKNDGKKTHVATLTIAGMDLFDADKFIKIATTGDFVGHWAQDQIVDAMIAGQVDVAENFRPQDGITRAEFAKIACTVFSEKVKIENASKGEPFHDVSNNAWYQKYVAALYNTLVKDENGKYQSVVQGDGENFRPNDKITRQEVAVIVAKLTSGEVQESTTPVNGTKVENIEKTKFKDTKSIAAWADESVKYLNETAKYTNAKGEQKAIVEGNNGYFNPTQDITRAEALVMVQRAASATAK